MWITPDEYNLDPGSGGIVVFFKKTIGNESFEQIQNEEYGRNFLKGHEDQSISIPYRQNRVVIFDSSLWHKTDSYSFAKGHKSRRINLTLLYGAGNFSNCASKM